MTLPILLLLNSLYIFGFYQCFQPGNIFERLNPMPHIHKLTSLQMTVKWKGRVFWLLKPVIGCVVCMASVHGLIFIYFFIPFITNTNFNLGYDIPITIFYIFALAGLNMIISRIADI